MKGNNKGVTLVELIVTIAIMGVIAVGIQGFTLTSAKLNSNVVSDVKLQYESQLVMANVQKHIANTSKGVFWRDANTLLMVSEADGTADYVKILFFNETKKTLYYGEGNVAEGGAATVQVYKLAEYVTNFEVSFPETIEVAGVDIATQANITLKMERNGEEYVGTQSVALRNKPRIENNNWHVTVDEIQV